MFLATVHARTFLQSNLKFSLPLSTATLKSTLVIIEQNRTGERMAIKSKKSLTLTLAVLLVITIASFTGALLYLYSQVNFRDSELVECHTTMDQQYQNEAQLNSQINSLSTQIASLNGQIDNLKGVMTANLVTSLGIHEILNNATYDPNNPSTFNYLYITGTVTNTGVVTADSAALIIVAYQANGNMVANQTVTLGDIAPEQVVTYPGNDGITVQHQGIATNWTITPVWTNAPP